MNFADLEQDEFASRVRRVIRISKALTLEGNEDVKQAAQWEFVAAILFLFYYLCANVDAEELSIGKTLAGNLLEEIHQIKLKDLTDANLGN